MRKYIFLLSIIVLSFSSCATFYGDNYNNSSKVKNLYLGMSKEDALGIMGNKYVIESISQENDGLLEVIKYFSSEVPYILHFLDGKLVLIDRYYPPYIPEQKVTIQHE